MGALRRAPERLACVTAHRGDSEKYRENTLAAIESARDAGADFVEVDVRVTADGQVVLLHDASLLRLWGRDELVSAQTYAQLAGLGSGTDTIPLLSEALELLRGSGSTLLIDMDEAAPAAAAAAVVQATGADVAWCGHIDAMRTIRSVDGDARIWLPWNRRVAPPRELLNELRPEFVNSEYVVLSEGMVEAIHDAGYRVSCWTVDDEADMQWVLRLGADAVTTNRLGLLQRTVDAGPGAWDAPEPPGRLTGEELFEAHLTMRELAEWAVDFTRTAERGTISTKANEADLVTAVDLAVERHVREVVEARFPGHAFVGEEYGGAAVKGVPCWYLDPVDGTTNLANGVPWTAFSLALAVDRTPYAAVVADPWRGEILEAVAGHGARRDGAELRIDQGREPFTSLAGAVVLTELAQHLPWPGMLSLLEQAGRRHATLRIMGSGTLTLAGIAAGRGAGAVIGSFGPMDHLAAALIVREAGGVVLDEDGNENLFPAQGGILAAAPGVAEELYTLWRAGIRNET
ncbi:inositol monophosphatase family protein [Paenarthrobacter sp. DKR-5]|uniref:inositol monophosphatase family protein n=1 Tax=Paenarthrobacter sp. DKR-5 TaxID=2835535 RepID=UPI002027732C|nr:inositol monophosphatase family protein [Paenarthrobacter sp. DKR-5]